MPIFNRRLLLLALPALAACTSMQGAPTSAAPDIYAGKSVLDAAIEEAGGEAALRKVKELYWTGTATVTAAGKATKLNVQTVVRPEKQWARTTTWPAGAEAKTSRTLQVERGRAWDVNRQAWTPLPEAQAAYENQQFGLYSLMLLAPLKDAGAKADEQPVGSDGARAIKALLPGGQAGELEFDVNGKLVRAGMMVRDPNGGADIVEQVRFSGEIVSNGVKWPKRITIEQNGAPFYDLEIATFEAAPATTPRPLDQSMQYEGTQAEPGEENAG